jgi:hypothetical protein
MRSNFSDGKALEYVDTDKSRVVLLELEKDWWIVAVSKWVSTCADLEAHDKPVYRFHSTSR